MTGEERDAEPQDPAGLGPAPAQQRPGTGDRRVDAALARLDELPGVPVTDHLGVFDDVHRQLQDVLDELDNGPGTDEDSGAAPGPGR